MARRRSNHPRQSKKNVQSRRYLTEALEPRTYFVVLHEGDIFEFWAESNHMERVVVEGNPGSTTVELIGVKTNNFVGIAPGQNPNLTTMDGQILAGPDTGVVGTGVPPEAFQGGGGTTGGSNGNAPTFSDDIWAIYVSKSDVSTRIAVATTPNPAQNVPLSLANRPMLPYTGAVTLLVRPTSGGQLVSVTGAASTGTAVLGTRAFAPQNNTGGGGGNNQNFPTNFPIYQAASFTPGTFTTLPSTQGSIGAGLYMTQGNAMGQFMFGGAMLGTVSLGGPVQLFYGGWIVTGNSAGGGVSVSVADNFHISGDVQSLLTNGSVGTNTDSGLTDLGLPTYVTGTDIRIDGKAGMVWSANSLVTNVEVSHLPNAPSLNGTPFQQIDVRVTGAATPWDNAQFGADPLINDTTPAGAQFLGTFDANGDVQVQGQEQAVNPFAKAVDYYAVPLIAGQTITVQLTSSTFGSSVGILNVGVFDAEQRLLATDYSNVDLTQTIGQPFQFHATTPGVYYFAVTPFSNNDFGTANLLGSLATYTLKISNVGDLAVGGVVAGVNILDLGGALTNSAGIRAGLHAANGDFGAAVAGNLILSNDTGLLNLAFGSTGGNVTIGVDNGNLRAVQAGSIGNATDPGTTTSGVSFGEIPSGYVPNGSIGMLLASSTANLTGQGATGILAWNLFVESQTAGTFALAELTQAEANAVAVGGDIQMIQASNFFFGDLVAKGSIGSIRANSMATPIPSYFQVNAANNPHTPGTIDVIDVNTQIGLLGVGGPAISTGPGGNVRYMHINQIGVGPTTTMQVHRDLFFGGGDPESTLYQPGETAVITDDSGSIVSLTPQNAADQLVITTYPIRSGGAAIVFVEVTFSPLTAPLASHGPAHGVTITSSSGGSAEIGTIQVDGVGTGPATGPAGGAAGGAGGAGGGGGAGGNAGGATSRAFPAPGQPGGAPLPTPGSSGAKFVQPTLPGAPTVTPTAAGALDISITGQTKIDVYSLTGPNATSDGSLNPGFGNVTSYTNTTGGELVGVHLNNIGPIVNTGPVGKAVEHNTAAITRGLIRTHLQEDGPEGAPYSYPLYEVSDLLRVIGRVVSINAGGIGNAYIGIITAAGSPPVNDPIPAPFSTPLSIPAGSAYAQVATSVVGSLAGGDVIGAFVASGAINAVSYHNMGWYGSGAASAVGIYSTGLVGPTTVTGNVRGAQASVLGQLGMTVRNGVISDAALVNFDRFDYSEARARILEQTTTFSPITLPNLDMGPISVGGNGGIIGTFFAGEHFGTISVADTGFGMFDSTILMLGDGTMQGVNIGGYGIRDGLFNGGASFGNITVRGNGTNIPTSNFSSLVRQGVAGNNFDPETGLIISFINDIDAYLGTTASNTQIAGVTDTGVIEDLTITGSRDYSSINAWSIRGRTLSNSLAPGFITSLLVVDISSFQVANMIKNMNVTGPINGLTLTTGRTSKFNFQGDVENLTMQVSGPIGNLVFNSSVLGNSIIGSTGPSGSIKSITIHGNFSGQINSTRNIGSVTIDGTMIGTIHAATLGTLKLTGGLGQGSLEIDGSVKNIFINGNLGVPGNTLTINGNLGMLKVAGNLNTNVSVANNLGKLLIAGSIFSATNVNVGNTISLLSVGGDIQAGAVITAHLIKKKVIKGQLLGTITTA